MAQRSNEKRLERQRKSDRNMYRAVILLIAGLVAEWYLLMAERYYARGSALQMLAWYDYLGVMRWVGLGVLAVGVVMWTQLAKKALLEKTGAALAAAGLFFAFSSFAMRYAWPTSVTAMCVFVPVVLILGIIYLFYQAEFSVQATALAMALFALALLGRSTSTLVMVLAGVALVGVAVLLGCTLLLKSNGGVLKAGEKKLRIFPANTDYRLTLAVLALCLALVVVAMLVAGVAFYATWALAVVAFVLAVYYTIKLM